MKQRKTKIIHCLGSLHFGGIERLVHDLVCEQLNRDYLEVSIGVNKYKGEFINEYQNLGVNIFDFKSHSGYDFNPLKIFRIYNIFIKFDVLHLHSFNLLIAIAALLSHKKIVYTEHGNFGFGRKLTISDKIMFFIRKMFFKYSKVQICANSNFTKNYLIKNFYSGDRLKLVYNGINSTEKIDNNLRKTLENKYKNNFVIGTTSRLAGFKRIHKLIELFHLYRKRDINSILVIVGDGLLRKQLEELVQNLKLENSVYFEGFQSDVSTYQSMFDVCVFPSENESFGLVAVECFYLKKPVLVFADGGGITEIISKIEPKDICDNENYMIQRLEYYKNNPFKWSNELDDYIKLFSIKRMEEEYLNTYQS